MEQPSFDKAQIRKYLLGDTPEKEQELIEMHLLTDEEFNEELSMTRTEMLDDYVAGTLSEHEKEEFEKYFLSTPEHVRMVEIGRALDKRLENRSHNLVPAKPKYYVRHLNTILSLAAGAILLVSGYVVWVLVKHRQPNRGVNEVQEQRAMLESELVRLNRPATGSEQSAFAVVPLNLKSILVRDMGENRSLAIPKTPSIVELRLELPVDKYQSYRASLQTVEGVELGAIDALTATRLNNGRVVVLDLPSWLMRPGSYQIKLTGATPSGQYEDITSYPFEITNQ